MNPAIPFKALLDQLLIRTVFAYFVILYLQLVINTLTMLLHKKSRRRALIQRLFKLIWSPLLELFKSVLTWIYLIVEQ